MAAAEVAAAGRVVMGLGEALGLGHAAGKQGPAHCSHCHWSLVSLAPGSRIMMWAYTRA